jgi:purine/pyrimidine-nucleoside phosphorylase
MPGISGKRMSLLSLRYIVQENFIMSEFRNVTVIKEANVYFDGKVTSRSVLFSDGSKKTLGVMLPGEYEFSTSDKELMEILSGELDVLLPGESKWRTISNGQSFEAAANSKFKLKVRKLSDYCCSFIKA